MNESTNVLSSINGTAQGLMVQQLAMDLAGSNIANANTPQYGRADLQVLAGSQGGGLQARVSRAAAPLAEEGVLDAHRAFAFSEAHYEYLRVQVAPVVGDMSADGLVERIGAFFGAWRNLSIEPASLDLRQEVLGEGTALAEALRSASERIFREQRGLDRAVGDLVDGSAAAIQEVAALNREIRTTAAAGASTVDLENRRAQAVHGLVGDLGVAVVPDADGATRLLVAGISVVSGDAAWPVGTRVDATTGFQHIVVDPSLDRNLDRFVEGGRLGAALATRDTDLGGLAASLDQLAADLATAVNTQHQAGFGLDTLGARDFFTTPPAPVAGFARTIDLAPAVAGLPRAVAAAALAANLPSESQNGALVAGLGDALVASANTQTFGQAMRTLATRAGRSTADARAQTDQWRRRLASAEAVRDAQMGVSQQEQLLALQRSQREYQAGLRILDMQFQRIDQLIALGGR